jgi:hypothetical protein
MLSESSVTLCVAFIGDFCGKAPHSHIYSSTGGRNVFSRLDSCRTCKEGNLISGGGSDVARAFGKGMSDIGMDGEELAACTGLEDPRGT